MPPSPKSQAYVSGVSPSASVAVPSKATVTGAVPVAGVEVWTWGESARDVRAITDEAGAFRLADAAAGPGFLFASGPGFRFAGRPIDAGSTGVKLPDLVLTRATEAPATTLAARPGNPAHRDLARTTIGLLIEPTLARGDAAARVRILEAFAGIDPERILTL